MKLRFFSLLTTVLVIAASCKTDRETFINEIRDTEESFAKMAAEKGIPAAFSFYAAEHGVISRSGKLIKGRDSIFYYYNNQKVQEPQLTWSPVFIDVAGSGDLGYTYGTYKYSFRDTTGVRKEYRGIFHTVWKRQPDGSWRFVWD